MLPTLFAPSFLTALKRACPVLVKDDYSTSFIMLTFTTAISLVDSTQQISNNLNKCHSWLPDAIFRISGINKW